MAGLKFCNVSKLYAGTPALDGINAEIGKGEFVALLGPSGCGKTTLLRLTAGFEVPDKGRVTLDDRVLADGGSFVPPEDRNIGIVFQSYALWPHKSVAGNVSYPLEVKGISLSERKRRVAEALDLTGLTAFADRSPAQLSGGQRQRVALARCLVADPRAVLLDEPLANLDLALRGAMQEAFTAFHQRTGATMVYVTHDQTEALALADRVAVMEKGRIRQFAAPEDLYDKPQDCFVAGFVGDGAVLPVRDASAPAAGHVRINVLGQEIEARSQTLTPTHVCVRPEQLRIDAEGPISGRVTACTYQGGRFRLTLAAHGATLITHAPVRASIGDELRLSLHRPWTFCDPSASASAPVEAHA
ncbi:ABC transporter ATP-binding protein [Roseibium suaedae]|uniref:Carbohydrate ABC transporter ATP-binding protein, CUT1 family n=1 Tax=Roseibium suaedae TaxID=735517 RepID=A0A1M7L8P3_9HYPH|nr:ABC transporter ATP-binding protein [Roseibium suaedae]SHM73927.1 carbohydrate ABC transporter ATP-binding protein, CUT1 family [Roseibium suaedae]